MLKRSVMLTISVLFFIVSVAGFAFSAGEQETKLSGTISAIDTAATSVTIRDEKGKDTTVTGIDEKTLGGLKTGDAVECVYAAKGGKNVCKSIMKKTGGAKPAAPGY